LSGNSFRVWAWLALAVLAIPGLGARAAEAADPRQITWDDLLPEGWTPPIAPVDHFFEQGPAAAQSVAEAPVVPAMNGQRVRLPGYLVPIDLDGKQVRSFLMVPYFGACIHVPPPPPNQVVFVRLEKPVSLEDPYGAHWVTGRLSTEASSTNLAEAAYTMVGEVVEVFDWDQLYEQQPGGG